MANFKSKKLKEGTKKLDKNQKKAVIIFSVLLGVLAVLVLLNFVLDNVGILFGKEDEESIYFCEPDWKNDILEDENYTCLDRYIYYTNGALSTRIYSMDDALNTDFYSIFFCSYFDAMINGKYDNFSGYYTQDYINKNGNFDMFTMQQIYDISVEYLGVDSVNDDGTQNVSFKVCFSIRRNDGTLWKKLPSNTARPMLFETVENVKDGVIEINSISFYKNN